MAQAQHQHTSKQCPMHALRTGGLALDLLLVSCVLHGVLALLCCVFELGLKLLWMPESITNEAQARPAQVGRQAGRQASNAPWLRSGSS